MTLFFVSEGGNVRKDVIRRLKRDEKRTLLGGVEDLGLRRLGGEVLLAGDGVVVHEHGEVLIRDVPSDLGADLESAEVGRGGPLDVEVGLDVALQQLDPLLGTGHRLHVVLVLDGLDVPVDLSALRRCESNVLAVFL